MNPNYHKQKLTNLFYNTTVKSNLIKNTIITLNNCIII